MATRTGSLSSDSIARWKWGVCPQTHNGNATSTVEECDLHRGGMGPPPWRNATSTVEECDLRKRRNALLLQDLHLHNGGPTHAHWWLPCQACPQLRSAAFPRCNTLEHKKTFTPIPTTIPRSLLETCVPPLDSAARFGLGGP